MSGHIFQPGISNGKNCNHTIPRIIRFRGTLAQPILRADVAPQGSLGISSAARIARLRHAGKALARFHLPNFTIVLRVSVEFLTTTFGPPLKKCQAEYCSMYGSSDERQSTGTITLYPRCAASVPVPMPTP